MQHTIRFPPLILFQGTGAVEGTLVTDQVAMGGLFITNQTFGLVMQASYEFNQSPNDGLLGMAYGSIARSRRPTYFENLIMQGKVAPFFSVSLERGKERGSEVSFIHSTATSFP